MDPLPPLPEGAKMLTTAPALPPLPQGATMLTTGQKPPAATPIDTGPDMAPPSTGEQILRGAYSPIDAALTVLEHQLGASTGATARLGARMSNDVIGTHIDSNAVHDAVSGALGSKAQPVTSEGQNIIDALGAPSRAIDNSAPGKAVNDTLAQLATKYPRVAAKLKEMGVGVGDVMNTAGLAAGGEGATAESMAAARSAKLPAPPIHDPIEQLKAAGYHIPESADDVEAARAVNPDITAELAKRAAGISSDRDLTSASIQNAKTPHNTTYEKAYSALPAAVPASSDAEFAAAVNGAGASPGTLTPKSAAVDNLKARALENPTLTPAEIKANIGNMREDGYTNLNSGDTDKVALGRAQLDIAKAHEGLVERNLPADAGVTLDDIKAARTSLAKINMIQRNMVGDQVNPLGIAREARNNAAVNGELRLIANLHDFAPKAAGLPQRAPLPRLGTSDLVAAGAGAAAGHAIGGAPGAMIGALAGGHNIVPAITDVLRRAFRKSASVPDDLTQAGLGDVFARGNGLEPGWGRPPPDDLSIPEQPLALAADNPASGGASPGGINRSTDYADVMAHGIEQPAAPGMTIQTPAQAVAGRAGPAPDFVSSETERLSGDLSLADSIAGSHPENNADLGHVMAQGVPEGIMSRTPHAGGEPLSLEPSQARGEGFSVNPLGAEPTLHELLSGARGTAEGYTVPDNLPPGKTLKADVFRGVPAGTDASTPGHGGASFHSPDEEYARGYAGPDGTVTKSTVNFKNALDVGSLPNTIAQLGLPHTANIEDVVNAAREAGYDGLRYTLGGAKNDVEIVNLKPKKGK